MKRCLVIGSSVESYSLSPLLHRTIYKELGLNDWEYGARDIKSEEDLKDFIVEVKREKYTGFNVTIPYKQTVMKYIDDTKPSAERIGAVNTVINSEDRLDGMNTDFLGFRDDLKETLGIGISTDQTALLLGAGGAGRAVAEALCNMGFFVMVYDLDQKKLEEIKRDFSVTVIEEKNEVDHWLSESINLIVNATPLGMKKGDPQPITLTGKNIRKDLKVYDVIYNRKTELIKESEDLGLECSGGLGMLVHQGIESFKAWSGSVGQVVDVKEEVIKEIIEKMRKEVLER